jgi:Flp pilus assembly protein TadG
MRAPWPRLRKLAREEHGTAAIEFAIVVGVLSYALLNCVDIARYFFLRTALENATQMAAQVGWKTCDSANVPATTNCTGFAAAVTTSLQSSTIGASVTQATGSPSEAYYCVDASGALVQVAAIGSKPADCSSAGNATATPGDYIKISTTYAFTPMFPGTMAASYLPAILTATTLMRLA